MTNFRHRFLLGALLSVSSLLASSALGNDTSVGGIGVDLHALKETSVRMKSEDIVISFVDDTWVVRATYVFENPTNENFRFQVGFPEIGCLKEEEGDCHAKAFRGLKTQVDGRSVVHRRGTLNDTERWAKHLGTFWLFDVSFPSQAETKIEHTYSMDATMDSMGAYYGHYVTRTGSTWAGPIGHAKFTLRFPPHVAHVSTNTVLPTPKQDPQFVVAEKRGFAQIVLEQENWTPSGDLEFAFATPLSMFSLSRFEREELQKRAAVAGVKESDLCPSNNPMQAQPETKEEAQACTNFLYAAWGYGFKKRPLHALYYSPPATWRPGRLSLGWARTRDPAALPQFDLKWISKTERAHLKRLTATENTSVASASPKEPPPAKASASKEKRKTGESAPPPEPTSPPAPPIKETTSSAGCSLGITRETPSSWWAAGLLLLLSRRRRRLPGSS